MGILPILTMYSTKVHSFSSEIEGFVQCRYLGVDSDQRVEAHIFQFLVLVSISSTKERRGERGGRSSVAWRGKDAYAWKRDNRDRARARISSTGFLRVLDLSLAWGLGKRKKICKDVWDCTEVR